MRPRKVRPGQLDIRALIEAQGDEWIGPGEINVLGGRFAAEPTAIQAFLGLWSGVEFAFALWNHTDALVLERVAGPHRAAACPGLLERARLFGGDDPGGERLPANGGDLEIRRTGGELRWRFIGPPDPPGLDGRALSAYGCQDFWAHHPETRLRVQRDCLLLWGQATDAGETFADPRVGKAQLVYPVAAGPGQRTELTCLTLSSAGSAAFNWWLGVAIHD